VTGYPLPYASSDLSGQVAIVTGGTSGLGWRFTQVLAAAGATVVPTGRRVERLAALREVIEEAGGRCYPIEMDMTDADSIVAGVTRASEEVGLVTIAVNNAGIPDARRAHRMPLELVDQVLDTNVRGPWVLSCEVARRLIDAAQPGRIVNISSVAAFHY